MTRGGQKKRPEEPERRCIATGQSQPKAGLIRFVVGPEGQIVPDLLGKLPGRGIYVTASRRALEKAVTKGLFARAAREPVEVPVGMIEALERTVTTKEEGGIRRGSVPSRVEGGV